MGKDSRVLGGAVTKSRPPSINEGLRPLGYWIGSASGGFG